MYSVSWQPAPGNVLEYGKLNIIKQINNNEYYKKIIKICWNSLIFDVLHFFIVNFTTHINFY